MLSEQVRRMSLEDQAMARVLGEEVMASLVNERLSDVGGMVIAITDVPYSGDEAPVAIAKRQTQDSFMLQKPA